MPMARTPESAAVDFAESSLFTGRFSILALAACGVGFSLSGRLPAAIFSLAAAAVAAAARLWARHVLDGVNAALQAERSCVLDVYKRQEVRMMAKMPKSPVEAYQRVPNRKLMGPISRMAGRPEMIR